MWMSECISWMAACTCEIYIIFEDNKIIYKAQQYIQENLFITPPLFSKILTENTLQLAHEGEIWVLFCEF